MQSLRFHHLLECIHWWASSSHLHRATTIRRIVSQKLDLNAIDLAKMSSPALLCFIVLSLLRVSFGSFAISSRQSCGSSYTLCAPEGASMLGIPPVGPGLASLYLNLLETIDALGKADQTNYFPAPHEPARRAIQMPLTLCCEKFRILGPHV